MNNVNVNLFDTNFKQKSLIKSESAIVNEKENRIKAFGNVSVESNDGKKLLTDSLLWDNSADKIFTNANLEFITSDTDTLYGKGFESNIDWWVLSPPSRNTYASPLFHNFCCIKFLTETLDNDEFQISSILVLMDRMIALQEILQVMF